MRENFLKESHLSRALTYDSHVTTGEEQGKKYRRGKQKKQSNNLPTYWPTYKATASGKWNIKIER